jgi:type II secretory pathway pseudopilin PulG
MEIQIPDQTKVNEKSSPQDFFLYLVTFLSLSFVAFGEGSILFGFINKFVTDRESNLYPSFNQGDVKFGIAALIIAGPIFFVISRIIVARISQQKISLESNVRKWLTYIVLFFAAATIIGDLITLVVNFLGGDFTSSFLLKVLVVLMIAGGIFGYYFWDMRRTEISSNINKLAMYICIVVLTISFVAGFFIIDSPFASRQKNIDQQTVSNMQAIDNSIQSYFGDAGKLPQKLDDMLATKYSFGNQTAKGLKYEITGEDSYQICADFLRSNLSDKENKYGPYENDWKHDAGNFCFTRVVLKRTDVAPIINK